MPRVVPLVLAALVLPACGGGDHAGHGTGGPADATVELRATDALRWEPATVTARAGQKVTFRITNTGKVRHEFVVGDSAYHDTHKASASPGASHAGHGDGGASVDVPPGQTATVTFTMPDAAPRFACYVDRHDVAGMTGTVVYGT